MLCLIGLKI